MLLWQEFRILSDIPVAAAPLWPPINTTQLEFHLIVSTSALVRVCFVVELIGCLFSNGKYMPSGLIICNLALAYVANLLTCMIHKISSNLGDRLLKFH